MRGCQGAHKQSLPYFFPSNSHQNPFQQSQNDTRSIDLVNSCPRIGFLDFGMLYLTRGCSKLRHIYIVVSKTSEKLVTQRIEPNPLLAFFKNAKGYGSRAAHMPSLLKKKVFLKYSKYFTLAICI